jgi:hypothetical protein
MKNLKLMVEAEETQVDFLVEASEGKKNIFIEGVFSTIGERNRNKRIYPRHIWESNVAQYQEELKNSTVNTLMEMEHPPRTTVDPLEAVAKITKLDIEGKYVIGKSKFLDNPKANIIKNLIDEGIRIGVSSRGVGNVGNDGVITNYKLICYDLTTSPSDHNANPNRVYECFVEGIYTDKTFTINESTGLIEEVKEETIIESKLSQIKKLKDYDRKLVETYILNQYKNLLK